MYIDNVCVSICIHVLIPYKAHKYTVYILRRYIVYISPVAYLDLDQAHTVLVIAQHSSERMSRIQTFVAPLPLPRPCS